MPDFGELEQDAQKAAGEHSGDVDKGIEEAAKKAEGEIGGGGTGGQPAPDQQGAAPAQGAQPPQQ